MASALVLNGKVVDVSDVQFETPTEFTWISNCPSDCKIGWEYDGTTFTDPTAMSADEYLAQLREERNQLLASTDWWALSDTTMTAEQTAYRQALRDITNTYSSTEDDGFAWPTKP